MTASEPRDPGIPGTHAPGDQAGSIPGPTSAGPGSSAGPVPPDPAGGPPYPQPGQPPYDSARQPPYGPPAGQPRDAQPGQPPYGQLGMVPVPPVPNRNKNRNILVSVLAVIAIAAVAFFVVRSRATDTVNAGVGACIQVVDANSTPPKTNQIACGDVHSTYVVTETGKNVSCDEQEAEFTQDNTDLKICLRPDLRVGDCAKVEGASNGDIEKIDCVSAGINDLTVVLFDQTTSDKGKCAEGQAPVAFATRNMIFCFAPANPDRSRASAGQPACRLGW